jgi:glyoxylase-like metal-dependent hydrolase (beta-lactamase superfamily II)
MITLPEWIVPLEISMPATLGSVNLYLIRGPSGTALIDTGMKDAGTRKELVEALRANGLALDDIDTLVCTHHHVDHAGLGRTFQRAGAETMMSEIDADSLELYLRGDESDRDKAAFGGCHEAPEKFIERVSIMFPFFRSLTEDFKPDRLLKGDETLDLGGLPFEVIFTPGHTLGHICLKRENFIVSGDCIISNEATHVSMRSEAVGKNPLGMFLKSLALIRDLGPHIGLPGHGPLIEDLSVRAVDILAHHDMRLGQIRQVLTTEPRPAFDLSVDAMGPRPKSFSRWLVMSQTLAYLEHLVHLGMAEEVLVDDKKRYRIGE